MRYREIVHEAISVLPAPETFGVLTRELPKTFLHFTHDAEMLASILRDGFDISRSGFTAKKLNAHEWAKNDPAGVFATDATEPDEQRRWKPWVEFTLRGSPLALVSRSYLFGDLVRAYGCSGQALSHKLLSQNVSVLKSVREFVILDIRDHSDHAVLGPIMKRIA